ncbi:hypothetical protein [Nostoc sp.]|uniref:hypothetical protein n=1 Tax=Nostoc sp. TaxID=1180 RepID=UPI002FFAAD84
MITFDRDRASCFSTRLTYSSNWRELTLSTPSNSHGDGLRSHYKATHKLITTIAAMI